MNAPLPSSTCGSGMGRAQQYNELFLELAVAAWGASASVVRWFARRGRRPDGEDSGGSRQRAASPTSGRAGSPARRYAPSTVCRYGQIARRFAAWEARYAGERGAPPEFADFLADVVATAGGAGTMPAGARRDPRHRALLRTTICAVRATVDGPTGLGLTAGFRLPPRAVPVPAAPLGTVAALRAAVRDLRERLLVMLACDLGLRPGQMVRLRWRDVCLPRGLVHIGGPRGGRAVVIPPACQAGLALCARGHAPGSPLFPSPLGGGGGDPVTVRTLQNALRRLAIRAGVPPGTTFSCLRKACPAGALTARPPARRPGRRASAADGRRMTPPRRARPSTAPGLSLPCLVGTPPMPSVGQAPGHAHAVAGRQPGPGGGRRSARLRLPC